MKNEFLSEVLVANEYLNQFRTNLPQRVLDWADRNAVEYPGYYRKNKDWTFGKVLCMSCLNEFNNINLQTTSEVRRTYGYKGSPNDKTIVKVTCPHCGHSILFESSRKSKFDDYCDFGIWQNVNGIRVLRVFEKYIYKNLRLKKANETIAEVFHHTNDGWYEVLRRWEKDGEEIITSRLLGMYSYNRRSPWVSGQNEPLEYHTSTINPYYYGRGDYEQMYRNPKCVCDVDLEDNNFEGTHQWNTIQDIIKRSGKRPPIVRIMQSVRDYPMIETLYNKGYVEQATYLANESFNHECYFPDYSDETGHTKGKHIYVPRLNKREAINAVRLCLKNKYEQWQDIRMYTEYLDQLKQFGKDVHSPYYVCPADFVSEHNKYNRLTEIREAARDARKAVYEACQRRERERYIIQHEEFMMQQKANEMLWDKYGNKAYEIIHKEFLPIEFTSSDKTLKFHVLQSIEEFEAEGKAMSHCVYRCAYYTKRNSIILSCRHISDDVRVATSEVDVNTLKILQTHGPSNLSPALGYKIDYINAQINAHMELFSKAFDVREQRLADELAAVAEQTAKKKETNNKVLAV